MPDFTAIKYLRNPCIAAVRDYRFLTKVYFTEKRNDWIYVAKGAVNWTAGVTERTAVNCSRVGMVDPGGNSRPGSLLRLLHCIAPTSTRSTSRQTSKRVGTELRLL